MDSTLQPRPPATTPHGAGLWRGVVVALVLLTRGDRAAGCEFGCNSTATLCGGPVQYVQYPFFAGYADDFAEFSPIGELALALDLRNRNITSILPSGLSCYFDHTRPLPPSDVVNAILLDDNALTEFPDVRFLGSGVVSIQNNSIVAVPSFAQFTGTYIINLAHNQITQVEAGAFSGFGGQVLMVNLSYNAIGRVEAGAFALAPHVEEVVFTLDHNRLTSLPPAIATGFSGPVIIFTFVANQITAVSARAFARDRGTLAVDLAHNLLTSLVPEIWEAFHGGSMLADLSHNAFSELPEFNAVIPSYLLVDLSWNQIHVLREDSFVNYAGSDLEVVLQHNNMTLVEPGAFGNYVGSYLVVNASFNQIASLGNGTLANFRASYLIANFSHNAIAELGPIFCSFRAVVICNLDFNDNLITGDHLKVALNSYDSSFAALTLGLKRNQIEHLPELLFNNFSKDGSFGVYTSVTLDMTQNPITSFDPLAFGALEGFLHRVTVSLNSPTAGPIQLPSSISFGTAGWDMSTGGTFNISLSNTSIDKAIVERFSRAHNPPGTLSFGLTHNGYTELADGEFATSTATELDFSHNQITRVSPTAFNYSFTLQRLILTNNHLTEVSIALTANLPVLRSFVVSNNSIVAVPAVSNHIARPIDASGNPLRCSAFGPVATHCGCPHSMTVSNFCGYVRCTPIADTNGCPATSIFNESNCSAAPWSACVPRGSIPRDVYYSAATASFVRVTDCATAYSPREGGYLKAYEFEAPTESTDRQCSICSTCPAGYDASNCTATSDTKCTTSTSLSIGDIAALALASLILVGVASLGVIYGRRQSSQRVATESELQLTEKLLGDVQHEKDLVAEENALMEQAWSIAESDLSFGGVIGEGSFGRVFKGTWGHIPVAIKILRHPMDDLDPDMIRAFNREVKFMRSIRHPHVLTFYGAGVDEHSRAYLVTELMAGSLKVLLLDHARELDWPLRLTFAGDIARGMRYLHEKGTVHRDLKADNCFVSESLRVKVADFGTGSIIARIQEQQSAETASASPPRPTAGQGGARDGRIDSAESGGVPTVRHVSTPFNATTALASHTMSNAGGSLLWMSPEALRGERVTTHQATAVDVYSYAIVLWEIWARGRPWDELPEQGIQFVDRLLREVSQGNRPQLPTACGPAPKGYADLMRQCWDGTPSNRPSFQRIMAALSQIRLEFGQKAGQAARTESTL